MGAIKKYVAGTICAVLLASLLIGIRAEAAVPVTTVTGVTQTNASDDGTSVTVEWKYDLSKESKTDLGLKFEVQKASKVNGTYTRCGTKKAYGGTSGTGNLGIFDLSPGTSYWVKVRVINGDGAGAFSAPIEVVTMPKEETVTNLKVSKPTETSITLSWKGVTGANRYKIEYNIRNNSNKKTIYTTGTSLTVKKLTKNKEYVFYVFPERAPSPVMTTKKYAAKRAYYFESSQVIGRTLPTVVTGLKVDEYDYPFKQVYLEWKANEKANGYQVQTNDGKKTKNYLVQSNTPSQKVAASRNKFHKARVRAYVLVNGKKTYGKWSSWIYYAQQPELKGAGVKDGIKVSWKSYTGAGTGKVTYTVYISNKPKSGYKKVGSTTKTTMTIKKYGSAKLKANTNYYIHVEASKKIGGKTYTSDKSK